MKCWHDILVTHKKGSLSCPPLRSLRPTLRWRYTSQGRAKPTEVIQRGATSAFICVHLWINGPRSFVIFPQNGSVPLCVLTYAGGSPARSPCLWWKIWVLHWNQIPRRFDPAEAAGPCSRNDMQCLAFSSSAVILRNEVTTRCPAYFARVRIWP